MITLVEGRSREYLWPGHLRAWERQGRCQLKLMSTSQKKCITERFNRIEIRLCKHSFSKILNSIMRLSADSLYDYRWTFCTWLNAAHRPQQQCTTAYMHVHSHAVPRVGYRTVARQLVALLLVKCIELVGIVVVKSATNVSRLVEPLQVGRPHLPGCQRSDRVRVATSFPLGERPGSRTAVVVLQSREV